MGLFGIKKAKDDSKSNNTFINNNVINASDYSNMPNNTVVGYNDPTQVVNYSQSANNETFVYSQVNNVDYNNQFVNNQVGYENQNMIVNDNVAINNSQYMEQSVNNYAPPVVDSNFQYTEPQLSNEVVVTVDSNVINQNDSMAEQTVGVPESVPFDNSALFELPKGAVLEPEVIEEEIIEEEILEEPVPEEPVLDPLDNGNNPIPVNPVAPKEEKKEEVVEEEEEEIPLFDEEEEIKTNLFTVLNLMVSILIKPATTIVENARKYKKMFDSLSLIFWVSILSFVFCLVGRIIAGCFSRTYNAISGASKIMLNFSGLFDSNNYVPYLLITLLFGLVLILIVALVYYVSSFINSKGVHMAAYFVISALAIVPIIIGFTIIHPIVSILSSGLALLALIFTMIYALIIVMTGVNSLLKFKTKDRLIIYNSVNIAVIISIMVFICSILSKLSILELSFFIG